MEPRRQTPELSTGTGPENPIKVLHVVTSLDPGGMENGVVNLANGLGSGFETSICCLERTGAFAERLPEPQRVTILGKQAGFSWRAVRNLTGHIRQSRPSILHTHNLGPLIYGALATFLGNSIPILHGEHSQLAEWERRPRRLRQRGLLYRTCRRIHAVSQELRRDLIEAGLPGDKIDVVVNGVDTERFQPADCKIVRKQLGLPTDGIFLGIVGQFGPLKRHAVLLEAFESLADHDPRLHLLVVGGGGSERARVEEQGKTSRHAGRIHFCGFQIDPLPYYQALDLLIVPSENEGMSNAALEAMSSGVPVLANDACGNHEVITSGQDGAVAAMATPAELAREIRAMLGAGERLPQMGRNARQTAVRRFSLATMMETYANLYRATLGCSSR